MALSTQASISGTGLGAAQQWLTVATREYEAGDLDKALRYARKSQQLFAGSASEALITEVTRRQANRDAATQCLKKATPARETGESERALETRDRVGQ